MKELKDYVNDLLTEQDVFGDYDISSDSQKEILHIINKFEQKLLYIIKDIVNTDYIEEDGKED